MLKIVEKFTSLTPDYKLASKSRASEAYGVKI